MRGPVPSERRRARVEGPGTLFVVATPIGNLEDITQRALRVLQEVELVAAEDTRRTANLLRHYQIHTPLLSLHEHNEYARVQSLVAKLQAGGWVALVSDAGTPGISDPGAQLVHNARAAGIRVEAIPGPSAVTAALSASGLAGDRFAFAGFPPIRSNDRVAWFKWVASLSNIPVICFEAPHRLHRTLRECPTYLGERPILAARELTKLHEQWLAGNADALVRRLPKPRGEFVLIFCPVTDTSSTVVSDDKIVDIFGRTTESQPGSRRDAIRETARSLGVSQKIVYTALERRKQSVK
jgi:16S rRNA (cytidine1402-2'-O)-methyltransferase